MDKNLHDHFSHYPIGYLMDVGSSVTQTISELRSIACRIECRTLEGANIKTKNIEKALVILEVVRSAVEDVEKAKTAELNARWDALAERLDREYKERQK